MKRTFITAAERAQCKTLEELKALAAKKGANEYWAVCVWNNRKK